MIFISRLLSWILSFWLTRIKSLPQSPIPMPADPITAGLNVAGGVITLVTQLDKEANTPPQIQAALEEHAQAAHDRLVRAFKEKDLPTIQRMAQMAVVLACLLFSGCTH